MEKAFDIVAIGEALIEFNQTTAGQPQYLQGFGGDTSNAVVAAARAGARCAYVSSVGNDSFGQLLTSFWQDAGVNSNFVAINSIAQTGLYFVTHGAQGHEFEYRRKDSAAAQMVLTDAQCEAFQQTRWLHGSGITLAISPTAREQYQRAVALARAAGARISFDSNLRLRLWSLEEARQAMLPAIAACDLFLPSLDDVTQLSGLQEPQAIVRWSHALGAREVVLKMGEHGVLVSDGQCVQSLAPIRVLARDATGAGDCFAGNLLARLCAGDSLLEAARYANAAAALSVQSYGAIPGLPYPAQVETLMAQHP